MSDIIYTAPSSAGTTINPTNNFLPRRSNATTFVDSCLRQPTNTFLTGSFSGNDNGFRLDSASNIYLLGNFAIGTTSYISVASGGFSYIYGGNVLGIECNFVSSSYRLGRFTGGNTTYLQVADSALYIRTFSAGINKGLNFDFSTDKYELGGLGSGNRVTFEANNGSNIARTTQAGSDNGFRFQFGIRRYTFGQISNNNTNNLIIDDVNNTITTQRGANKTGISLDTNINVIGSLTVGNQTAIGTNDSSQSFVFNGTGITTPTATGTAGHLKVLVNGTPYRIQLLNP